MLPMWSLEVCILSTTEQKSSLYEVSGCHWTSVLNLVGLSEDESSESQSSGGENIQHFSFI